MKGSVEMYCKEIMSSKICRSILVCIVVAMVLLVPGCKSADNKQDESKSVSGATVNKFSRSLESVRYNDVDIICGFPEEKMKSPVLYSLDAAGNKKIIYRPQKNLRIEELELLGDWIYFFEMESDNENKVFIPGSDGYRCCERYAKRFLSKIKADGSEYQQIKEFNKDTSVWNLRVDGSGNIYYLMSESSADVKSWLWCYNLIDGSEKMIGCNHDEFDLRDGKVYAIDVFDYVQYMLSSDRRDYMENDSSGKWGLHIYNRAEDGTFLEEKRLDIQNYYELRTPIEYEGSVYYVREDKQTDGGDKKDKKEENDVKLTLCKRAIEGDWAEKELFTFDKIIDASNLEIFDGYVYYYECENYITISRLSGFGQLTKQHLSYRVSTALCRRKIEPNAEKEIIYVPDNEDSEKAGDVEIMYIAPSFGKMCYFGDCIVIEKPLQLPFVVVTSSGYDPGYKCMSLVKIDLKTKQAVEIGGAKKKAKSVVGMEKYYWTGAGRNIILTYPTGKYMGVAEDKIFSVDDWHLRSWSGTTIGDFKMVPNGSLD